jgi:hypothetical protein
MLFDLVTLTQPAQLLAQAFEIRAGGGRGGDLGCPRGVTLDVACPRDIRALRSHSHTLTHILTHVCVCVYVCVSN